jgi:hypothetical protein
LTDKQIEKYVKYRLQRCIFPGYLAGEAVDLARDASITAREVANLAREEPAPPPSIHVVAKNIMAKKCEMILVQKKLDIIICKCVLCECVR